MMTRRVIIASATLLALLAAAPVSACLWDYDTLAMETLRFPDTLELITGRFVRHSKEYYHWRVKDRQARLQDAPEDPRLIDDLTVAWDKLGEHQKAIDLMREQLARDPERYESHANLGTFLIHSGDLEGGLKHIERAMEINPNAHFGREIYQAHLVRYVLKRRSEVGGDKTVLPLRNTESGDARFRSVGFAAYLEGLAKAEDPPQKLDRAAAIKGVLGMMRFGHYDSPVLLEALGDLLSAPEGQDAKRMATRAYLMASYQTKGEASNKYKEFAKTSLQMQTKGRGSHAQMKVSAVKDRFDSELRAAEQFIAGVWADEKAWIRRDLDVDKEFERKYYQLTNSAMVPPPGQLPVSDFRKRLAMIIGGLSVGIFVFAIGLAVVSKFVFPKPPHKPGK